MKRQLQKKMESLHRVIFSLLDQQRKHPNHASRGLCYEQPQALKARVVIRFRLVYNNYLY